MKKSKSPEDFTQINHLQDEKLCLDERAKCLIDDHVLNVNNLDEQILGLRRLILLIYTNTHRNDTIHFEEEKTIANLSDIVAFWFFNLPSSSVLRPVIATAINKSEPSISNGENNMTSSIGKYVDIASENVIMIAGKWVKSAEEKYFNITYNEHIHNFVSCITRCFENNCEATLTIIKRNKSRIVDILEEYFFSEFNQYVACDDSRWQQLGIDSVVKLISDTIRISISLQSTCKMALSSTFLETIKKIQKCIYSTVNNKTIKLDQDAESNLSLLVVNETIFQYPDKYIQVMIDDGHNVLQNSVINKDDTIIAYIIQIVNALAIASCPHEFFRYVENPDMYQAQFHQILEAIEHSNVQKRDPLLAVMYTMALYNIAKNLQKSLNTGNKDKLLQSQKIMELLAKIEDQAWNFIGHNTDKVKHNTRNIINVLTSIYRDFMPSNYQLEQLILKALEMPWEQKTKYIALLSILKCPVGQISARINNAKNITNLQPNIPQIMVENLQFVHPSIETYCADLYETLLTNDFARVSVLCQSSTSGNEDLNGANNSSEYRWFVTWFEPILNLNSNCFDKISLPVVEKIIKAGMGLSNIIVEQCINYHSNKSSNDENRDNTDNILKLSLIALKQHKLGRKSVRLSDSSITNSITTAALSNFKEEIRVQAFDVIICSKSSKQIFENDELEMLLTSIPTLMVTVSRATRQDFLHLIKGMFKRIVEGLEPNKTKNEDSSKIGVLSCRYDNFLLKLGQFIFSCFFQNATFSRRASALEILKMYLSTFCQKSQTLLINVKQKLCTKDHAKVLVNCIEDPFEQNKHIAIQCLGYFPVDSLIPENYEDKKYVTFLWKTITELRYSHKPPLTISAAYMLLYTVQSFPKLLESHLKPNIENPTELMLLANEYSNKYNKDLPPYIYVLDSLLASLKSQIAMASKDLIEASEKYPMYGTLFCIRSMLTLLKTSSHYSKLITLSWLKQLVDTMLDANDIVANVINNDSPEGHLPMDIVLSVNYDKNEANQSIDSVGKVSSQKLLLCAWRTSKETSLLLGDIAVICYEMREYLEKNYLAWKVLLTRISSVFISLLSEIKHRGAFEQAYIGFCQICLVLWKTLNQSNCAGSMTKMNQQSVRDINMDNIRHNDQQTAMSNPLIMLQEALISLNSNDSDSEDSIRNQCSSDIQKAKGKPNSLCSTRRSAGIPFLIQGIVATDPDKNLSSLKFAFRELFELAKPLMHVELKKSTLESDIMETNNDSSVHACNILRVLYRDSGLGDAVLPYVADGVIAAINGFKAKSWPIRNSATLLFSALVTRIFGVKRSKNELSKKNSMTARTFFQRFPKLYKFLLEQINIAADQIGTIAPRGKETNLRVINPEKENPAYPSLIILAKLLPSPVSEISETFKIEPFLPSLKSCCGSAIYRIRELASQAYVSFTIAKYGATTSIYDAIYRASSILEHAMTTATHQEYIKRHNYLHGNLLQIKYIFSIGNNQTGMFDRINSSTKQNSDSYKSECNSSMQKQLPVEYSKVITILCKILTLKSRLYSLPNPRSHGCLIIKALTLDILGTLLSYHIDQNVTKTPLSILKIVHDVVKPLWDREIQSITTDQKAKDKLNEPGHMIYVDKLVNMYLYVKESVENAFLQSSNSFHCGDQKSGFLTDISLVRLLADATASLLDNIQKSSVPSKYVRRT